MNNVFVYCEVTEERTIADVSLELVSKGKKLAKNNPPTFLIKNKKNTTHLLIGVVTSFNRVAEDKKGKWNFKAGRGCQKDFDFSI